MSDMVDKEKFSMDLCRFVVLDEADRLLDMIFEKEIRNIIDHIPVFMSVLLPLVTSFHLRALGKRCCSPRQCRRKYRTS